MSQHLFNLKRESCYQALSAFIADLRSIRVNFTSRYMSSITHVHMLTFQSF
ncbi:hypothetical protein APHDU1_0469 [Anaplasma phagocytophilum]|nr:hypothetical protein APHDU1_0469 [Anaplasma phagocytophilum]